MFVLMLKRNHRLVCRVTEGIQKMSLNTSLEIFTRLRSLNPVPTSYLLIMCGYLSIGSDLLDSRTPHLTKERPFLCKFCPMSVTQLSCGFCIKAFVSLVTLTDHIRIYTSEKPYKFNQCGKAFALHSPSNARNPSNFPQRCKGLHVRHLWNALEPVVEFRPAQSHSFQLTSSLLHILSQGLSDITNFTNSY